MCPSCGWPWEIGDNVSVFAIRHLRHLSRSAHIGHAVVQRVDQDRDCSRVAITVYSPRRFRPFCSIWMDVDNATARRFGTHPAMTVGPYLRDAAAVVLAQLLLEGSD